MERQLSPRSERIAVVRSAAAVSVETMREGTERVTMVDFQIAVRRGGGEVGLAVDLADCKVVKLGKGARAE